MDFLKSQPNCIPTLLLGLLGRCWCFSLQLLLNFCSLLGFRCYCLSVSEWVGNTLSTRRLLGLKFRLRNVHFIFCTHGNRVKALVGHLAYLRRVFTYIWVESSLEVIALYSEFRFLILLGILWPGSLTLSVWIVDLLLSCLHVSLNY